MSCPAILFILKKVQVNICLNFKGSVYFYFGLKRYQVQTWYLGISDEQQLWTEASKVKAYLPNPKSDKERTLKPNLHWGSQWRCSLNRQSLISNHQLYHSSVPFKALLSTYYGQIIMPGPQKDLKISGKHSIVLTFKFIL